MPTFPLDPNMPKPETITPASGLTPTIRERVERGAAWLDSVKPEWRYEINARILDIADSAYCVLGQVFAAEASQGDYADGCDYVYARYVAPGSGPWMVNHGFDSLDYSPGAYADLETAWRRYLDGREW